MSYCDVYIGDLDDPNFTWTPDDEKYGRYNAPRGLSPTFPPAPGPGYGAFTKLKNKIKEGEYRGDQTDWGTWVAVVTRTKIMDFIKECYPGDWYENHKQLMRYMTDEYDKIVEIVEGLDPDKKYALVARET